MQTNDTRIAPASLTIFDVRQLENTVQSSLNNKQHVSIDLQQLTELDAAGVQWLLSLELRGLTQVIQLLQPNAFCLEQLGLMGLKQLVGGAKHGSS